MVPVDRPEPVGAGPSHQQDTKELVCAEEEYTVSAQLLSEEAFRGTG